MPKLTRCKYGDPLCPCQDGDMCHYEGPNPMKPPMQPACSPRNPDWWPRPVARRTTLAAPADKVRATLPGH